jgi:hypothetical protein
MKKIYLVVRFGPEWSETLNAHSKKKAAKARANQLIKENKDSKDALEQMSSYQVEEVELDPEQKP